MWGKRNNQVSGLPGHIVSRVEKMSDSDLTDWSDQAIYTVGRYLSLYHRARDEKDLSEALTGAQVLLAIVEETARRAR